MRSDVELVDAARRGDADAFGVLVHRYERAVVAEATGVLRDPHTAQDAAQEAFVSAYGKVANLRNGSAFGSWILRIARRHALRLARRSHPGPDVASTVFAAPQCRDGPWGEESQRLLRAVMQLPEHERVVVMLKYFDGHSARAIGEMTGQPVATETKKLSRARARLRDRLGDLGP